MFQNLKIALLFLFFLSLSILVISVVVGLVHHEKTSCQYASIILITLSSSILFPLTVGYFYDKIRERREGQSIWRLIREFVDGGIWRVYKDREGNEAKENAENDLVKSFNKQSKGEIKIIGVTLRVFFHETSHFYQRCIKDFWSSKSAKMRALICHPDSPEILHRAEIEEPSSIKADLNATIGSFCKLISSKGALIEYGCYSSAPYCTLIIFPDKCYFSPNILSQEAPVRLPMIVFRAGSHGYKVLENYFDYLWERKIDYQIGESKNL